MKRFDVQTRCPDDLASQTIGLLRWALMALIVVIHTNLVADTGCSGTVYGNLYRWAGNVVWLASPLFFLISGYLFVASDGRHRHRVLRVGLSVVAQVSADRMRLVVRSQNGSGKRKSSKLK